MTEPVEGEQNERGALARLWAERRPRSHIVHVDTAACGRTSTAVRARLCELLEQEAREGGYVAEAAAADELYQARHTLGLMLGFDADDVAFVESGSAALAQLLASWPLQAGDSVWAAPSEWGPNLSAFDDHALAVVFVDVDSDGVIDVAQLEARLSRARPVFMHLTAAAAHRALVQPVAEVVEVCARFDVPVVVDSAQALGQIPISEMRPAAAYGTGRKYLCGPRGVGYLAVRDPWQALLVPRAPAIAKGRWPGEDRLVRRLESREASIAGRVGLGVALREFDDLGPDLIRGDLQAAADALRVALEGHFGWRLRDPVGARGAIVSLVPDEGIDVAKVRGALLDRGVVTTAAFPERAPGEMTQPLLRFSPHVDLTSGQVDRIARALAEVTHHA